MNIKEFFQDDEKRDLLFILISIIAVILSLLGISLFGIDLMWITIIFCGFPIFIEAAVGLYTEFDIKADVLVTIAIISSILIGELFAAGVIAIIMAIGGFLEEYTVSKTRAGIEKLIDLSPTKGSIIRNYNQDSETEEEIAAELINVGDILKVLPGEVIPVDGEIIRGESSIDQSVMTGESIPVDKVVGDEVFSGTINLYGSFIMKATKKGEDSSLQKLITLVESANPENAEVVKSADRWASFIVVVAFICAILTLIFTAEIIRAVTILVVFCPCALVLATPTAIMASIGNLTKVGILVKEGISIEKLAKIDQIIFDKTGTLTYGKPTVTKVIPYNNEISDELSEKELIHLLASLESPSEHPLAKAITKFYKDKNEKALYKVTNFEMIIGKGVKANLNDSTLCAGNEEFFNSLNIDIPHDFIEENISQYLNQGSTVIYISCDGKFLGAVFLSDVLRDDAFDIVRQLHKLGVDSTLLTGDNKEAAEQIAHTVDIVDLKYNCLPEDKISKIRELQSNNKKIAMIGDGINDAPALRQADIGISMGGVGSDISIEASDVCLVSDDIKYIPHLFALSRKTIKTINRGIAFALGLNILATVLAMLGWLGPIGGAFVHNIGSVIVIIYSSLLLRFEYK
ncbi:copper-(or silver)-translocating P-type ATPase [Methanobrevibacter olleyae]|uniref:Copper-(Or silver)-translocating P-type ATPase n=1 Tax=Methanobrevibacter olleyae TaxID=294671 RepID=A0A1I4FUH6_METOL|nr:cation-translocating P-type ATPase [Methanobrevibacter olleyae]SFL21079.1 copper-(or silver)-translocating P-type ATPase [Methanobrevibacter olleyae]